MTAHVIATSTCGLTGAVALASAKGPVTLWAIGDDELFAAASASGADTLNTVSTSSAPAESFAPAVAMSIAESGADLLVSTNAPAARVVLGIAAAGMGLSVVTGVLSLNGDSVERRVLGGKVIQTLSAANAAVVFEGEDVEATSQTATTPIAAASADLQLTDVSTSDSAGSGIKDASVVVSIGRGVKAQEDLAIIEELAGKLGAEIGCSMPIADDFGWVAKDHYVGRSGQHIAPKLYLAVGISGAPQHLEGVRDARTIVAINSDVDAAIFEHATYGIVGDLYEIVPAITAALQ